MKQFFTGLFLVMLFGGLTYGLVIDTGFDNAIQYIRTIYLTDTGNDSGTTGVVLWGDTSSVRSDNYCDSAGDDCFSPSAIGTVASGATAPAGSDEQIQYNDGGSFGASANLTYDGETQTIQSVVGQTTNLSTWKNSVGDVIGGMTSTGQLYAFGGGNNIENMALGLGALENNTIGLYNVAIGTNALGNNTTGTRNFALGNAALVSNTTGDSNVAIGTFAMAASVSGSDNVAIGKSTLTRNISGGGNTAVGNYALNDNTEGQGNVGIGLWAGAENTTGLGNVAIGLYAGGYSRFGVTPANSSGNINTYIGSMIRGTDGASNEIVIGGDDRLVGGTTTSIGNGSNTATIGNSATEKTYIRGTIQATDINFTGLPIYADDAAAGVGGLVAGDVYQTPTGELRIKL